MDKCSICGGNILVNTDSAIGTCDSCGNSVEIDAETVKKYKNLIALADRKMMLNSVNGYNEAIEILNDITFVDGVDGRIRKCNQRIAELNIKAEARRAFRAESEANESKIGTILLIVVVIAFLLMAAAVGFTLYKLFRGELTQQQIYIVIGIAAVSVIMFIAGKLKS